MSRFRPTRASSPLSPCIKPPAPRSKDILDNSTSSILSSVPELSALTSEEIEFIDTVIQRAGGSATTFLTVFKAYNDILQERGLEPQHEVVYYGKLLKLGTLKGKNWGEKWDMVKRQQGTKASKITHRSSHRPPQPPINRAIVLTRLTTALKAIERDDDVFTLHSHQDETDSEASDVPTQVDVDQTPSTGPPAPRSIITIPSSVPKRHYPIPIPLVWDGETSEATVDTAQASSTIPPSYGAATRDIDIPPKVSYTPLRALAQAHSKASSATSLVPSISHPVPASARAAVMQARQRRGSIINEDDAWKKIKMAQDEKEADRFREDRLVERCWEVWKQGFQWIIRWQQVYKTHRNAQAFADHYHSAQLRYKMLLVWRLQLRAKLKQVKQGKVAEKFFVLRTGWKKWADKIIERKRERKLKEFEAKVLRRYLQEWLEHTKAQLQRKLSEEVIRQRVDLRIATTTLNHWTNRVADLKFRELETSQRYDTAVVT
ncbi:hypothetical protein EW026_g6516 [Hermanssonia centrifuga]|uniref:Sfi1 spindle body domain-containing protein n=1 Tax=Hermanssonia centrifuga TaxID=98765 RepID=A0A4S4KBS0_9APHY|nr:hypothetical protein EW026_g6516 [Hermanssonia centrifuga]